MTIIVANQNNEYMQAIFGCALIHIDGEGTSTQPNHWLFYK